MIIPVRNIAVDTVMNIFWFSGNIIMFYPVRTKSFTTLTATSTTITLKIYNSKHGKSIPVNIKSNRERICSGLYAQVVVTNLQLRNVNHICQSHILAHVVAENVLASSLH